MPIDIFATLAQLGQERHRAAIIHAPPDKGPVMTQFCHKMCKQAKGQYLDLLELFIQSPELSDCIDSFGPEKLKDLLVEKSGGQTLLVVDRADFLLDTWRKSERQDFYKLIDKQWDGFKYAMRAELIVVLQRSHELEAIKMAGSQVRGRIFQLTDFNEIA